MKADRLVALAFGASLVASVSSAALAQDQPAGTMAPDAMAPSTMGGGAEVDNVLGTGALPGVGLGTSTAPDVSGIGGPGGLQNGVGAQGMSAPSMSGSAVTNDGSIPGTSDTGGFGIPLGAPAASNN
ncbi:hypothetical protein [Aureimonas frigidaquae]|uniref:hypothetical protein n=1 Tax=Aureimonas frigidaquae TaxID=424757 RepID=UPI000784CF68|nr:hypothetical protein [Aureimonas frigidaquae]